MTLRGFLVSIHCPSEELLTVTVDCSQLPPATYMQLVSQLQDLLSSIDEAHAAKETRGRSLRARYRRVSANERLRLLKFSPFPSRVLNRLKTVRERAYEILNRCCLVLTSVESGFYRENAYLLPEDRAEEFATSIQRLDASLAEVRAFVASYDLSEVELLLSRYGLAMPSRRFSIPDIRVDLLPVSLEAAVEEWARRSEAVRQLLARRQEELVRSAVEAVRKKLEPILKAMEGEARLARLEGRLEDIRRLAESLGLKALADSVVAPLLEACRGNVEALGGMAPSEFARGRIESLFR
jgi:DNA-binding transcriptional MerR regulator